MWNPDLRRWVAQRLVFLFPFLCILAGLGFLAETVWFQMKAKITEGEVVRVYEREGSNFMERGAKLYSPVLRYTWSDGNETEASTGQAFQTPFKIGEKHKIIYDPGVKGDVRLLRFTQIWALPLTLLAIGFGTLLPALAIWFWLIRPRISRPRERRIFCLPGSDDAQA